MVDDPNVPTTKPSWVSLLYFYLAALTGLIIVIVGAIMAVNSGVDALFFEPVDRPPGEDFYCYGCADDRGDELKEALKGVLVAAVGMPIFLWHIRHARRREDQAT